MAPRLYKMAEKQPINISAPTFLDQIDQFLPTIINNPALQNTGISTQTDQISNAINQIRKTKDPESIKQLVQRIDNPLKQILTVINTKMPSGGQPSDTANTLNTIKSFGDQIAKWNKSVGVVPALPPQMGKVVQVPPQPFSANIKGPRNVPMRNLMAPTSPAEWQEAEKALKEQQPQQQQQQSVSSNEWDQATRELNSSSRERIKVAKDKRIDESDNEWMALYTTPDGYIYATELRGDVVAILGYRENDGDVEFVGRFERVPCHENKMKLVSLTGGVEEDEDPEDAAVREMQEEAGIKVSKEDLIDLGTVQPVKSMDTVYHLFGVDIEDQKPGKAPGDGSDGEEGTYSKLVSMKDIINSDNSILHSLLIRLLKHID